MQRTNPQRAGECANCYETSDRLFDPPVYAADCADTRYYAYRVVWWKHPGQVGPADICDVVDEDNELDIVYLRWSDFSEAPICWSCYGQNVSVTGVRYLCNKPPQIVLNGWHAPDWKEATE